MYVKKGGSFTIGCSLKTPANSALEDYKLEWLINDKVIEVDFPSDFEVTQKKISNNLISEISQRDAYDSYNLKCRPRGYSMEISKNIQVYSSKFDALTSTKTKKNKKFVNGMISKYKSIEFL